jgi:hypothetical protein
MRQIILGLLSLLPILSPLSGADLPAARPPMGWNSWDAYGTTVTEAEVKANADYMAKNLKAHGWQYVVVDIQWSEPNARAHGYRENAELAMDGFGRLIPAENRFPSSDGGRGFKPLADYVHGLGLKFGIHIMRGIPRQAVRANLPVFGTDVKASDIADQSSICPWNSDMYGVDVSRRGGQEYYDSLLRLYAGWGVEADLRRLLGRLAIPETDVPAAVRLGRRGPPWSLAGRRHAPARPYRSPRRARRFPHDPLHPRRSQDRDEPVVDRPVSPDLRRRPALQ